MIHLEPIPAGDLYAAYMFVDDRAVFKVDDYDGICTVRIDQPDTCWISGFKAEREGHRRIDRRVLRQLLEALQAMGIRFIRATRAEGRNLPRARLLPDNTFLIDIHDLLPRDFVTDFGKL